MALLWPYVAFDANVVVLLPTCPAVSCRSATVLFSRKNIYEMLELYVKWVESLREQRMLILSVMSQSSHWHKQVQFKCFAGLASACANSRFGPKFLNQVACELLLCYCFCLYCVREVCSLTFHADKNRLRRTIECENPKWLQIRLWLGCLKGWKLVIQCDECCHLSVTLSILSQLLSGWWN